MPMHNEWARQALKYTIIAVKQIESKEEGIYDLERILERPQLYLEHHADTAEYQTSDKNLFHKIMLSAVTLCENTYAPEETLRRLKIQAADLYEYLGEEPPVNDPNQLKINFDEKNNDRS